MQISKREASFLAIALETKINNTDLYISKIESGDIPNHDPSTFELSKQFQQERKDILSRLQAFMEIAE